MAAGLNTRGSRWALYCLSTHKALAMEIRLQMVCTLLRSNLDSHTRHVQFAYILNRRRPGHRRRPAPNAKLFYAKLFKYLFSRPCNFHARVRCEVVHHRCSDIRARCSTLRFGPVLNSFAHCRPDTCSLSIHLTRICIHFRRTYFFVGRYFAWLACD